MRFLSSMDIHTIFLQICGSTTSAASIAQNCMMFGSEEISLVFKDKIDEDKFLQDIYSRFLLKRGEKDLADQAAAAYTNHQYTLDTHSRDTARAAVARCLTEQLGVFLSLVDSLVTLLLTLQS